MALISNIMEAIKFGINYHLFCSEDGGITLGFLSSNFTILTVCFVTFIPNFMLTNSTTTCTMHAYICEYVNIIEASLQKMYIYTSNSHSNLQTVSFATHSQIMHARNHIWQFSHTANICMISAHTLMHPLLLLNNLPSVS